MNKTITSWLGAVPTGLFLAAVRHSPSLYLLFISPASPCCGCMCVGGVRVRVCVGVGAALFSPDYPLSTNSGYFWLRPSGAIHQHRPCPRTLSSTGKLAGLVDWSSRVLVPPPCPFKAGSLSLASASRQTCLQNDVYFSSQIFPRLGRAVNCHLSAGLVVAPAGSVASWAQRVHDVSATTSRCRLANMSCSPTSKATWSQIRLME